MQRCNWKKRIWHDYKPLKIERVGFRIDRNCIFLKILVAFCLVITKLFITLLALLKKRTYLKLNHELNKTTLVKMAGKINLTDELKKYFGFNKFKGRTRKQSLITCSMVKIPLY